MPPHSHRRLGFRQIAISPKKVKQTFIRLAVFPFEDEIIKLSQLHAFILIKTFFYIKCREFVVRLIA